MGNRVGTTQDDGFDFSPPNMTPFSPPPSEIFLFQIFVGEEKNKKDFLMKTIKETPKTTPDPGDSIRDLLSPS